MKKAPDRLYDRAFHDAEKEALDYPPSDAAHEIVRVSKIRADKERTAEALKKLGAGKKYGEK